MYVQSANWPLTWRMYSYLFKICMISLRAGTIVEFACESRKLRDEAFQMYEARKKHRHYSTVE
jgi:hypothetical protein